MRTDNQSFSDLEKYFHEGTCPYSYPFLPFYQYLELLLKWNSKINLTSITDPKRIIEEHFIDSLAAIPYLNPSSRIIDIGSGAGLPGIPLSIVLPGASITLCESIKKKADFLKEVVRRLKLPNVTVETIRLDVKSDIGEFDSVVSRGTMEVNDLLAITKPLLRRGGEIIAYKGPNVDSELNELGQIGFERVDYQLPYSRKQRVLIIYKNDFRGESSRQT